LFQDVQVERVEQAALEPVGQARQDVPGQRQLIQQGGIGGLGSGDGEGVELGLEVLAFGVELAEPGADPAPHRGGRGVGRVGGELLEFEDAGVLPGTDLLDPGSQGGGLGVPVRAGLSIGGGELGFE
jgi:hypothetical protein